MMRIKKLLLRVVVMVEMIGFGYLYFFGNNGMSVLQKQREDVVALRQLVVQLQGDVDQLENEIYAWQTDDFYKEKVAREQLQMARKGDEIYYIGT
jgi:cell division protein FtsB